MRRSLLVLLVVANLATAIAVVYSTYKTRQLFGDLQQLENRSIELKTQYSRLLLEKSAWASPGRIEQSVREQLNMRAPEASEIQVLELKP